MPWCAACSSRRPPPSSTASRRPRRSSSGRAASPRRSASARPPSRSPDDSPSSCIACGSTAPTSIPSSVVPRLIDTFLPSDTFPLRRESVTGTARHRVTSSSSSLPLNPSALLRSRPLACVRHPAAALRRPRTETRRPARSPNDLDTQCPNHRRMRGILHHIPLVLSEVEGQSRAYSHLLEIDLLVNRQALEVAAQAVEAHLDGAEADPVAAAEDTRSSRDDGMRGRDRDVDRGAEIDAGGALVALDQDRQRAARAGLTTYRAR